MNNESLNQDKKIYMVVYQFPSGDRGNVHAFTNKQDADEFAEAEKLLFGSPNYYVEPIDLD
jgi:hypothetical protein